MPEYSNAEVQAAEAAPSEPLKSTSTSSLPTESPAPAEAPVEATETPSSEGDAHPADSPRKEGKLPRWVKERMERVRRVTEAETRERVLNEVRTQQPQREPERPVTEAKTLADFDFDNNAYTQYLVSSELDRRDQQREAEKTAKAQADAAEKLNARIDAFETKVGDGAWEDFTSSEFNNDPKFAPLFGLFMGDDNDLEIAHHLAVNHEEAERLLSLSPVNRAREIAKLADRFGGVQETPAPVPVRKTTNAPPPPKTVAGSGAPSANIYAKEMTPEQRIRALREQGAFRR